MMTREHLGWSAGLIPANEHGGAIDRDGVEQPHLLAAARLCRTGLWWTWAGVCQLGLAARAAIPPRLLTSRRA